MTLTLNTQSLSAFALALTLACAAGSAQNVLRTHDAEIVRRGAGEAGPAPASGSGGAICSTTPLAWDGQMLPNGPLVPSAFVNPATITRSGAVVFYSPIAAGSRNHSIFTADGSGLLQIATGCGGGGGSGVHGHCGDVSPIGGTFAGFFSGTFFVPGTNDGGDILFLADIISGSSPRGLFLYDAARQGIVKVAAVGDPSPLGGTFDAIGPGSTNNLREVVFLARNAATKGANVFLWRNGTVTKVAAAGDPAPGGGTYSALGTEEVGFADSTTMPVGPVPAINDRGQITFRAIVSGGITGRGIVVSTNGSPQWYVKAGDPTPMGGSYVDLQAACINAAGDIAFLADVRLSPSTVTSAWIVGSPAGWRKALAFGDPIEGNPCVGLAFSRNPMTPLDDRGNLLLWTKVARSGGDQERLVVAAADGSLVTAAAQGDPTPLGGTIGTIDAWPSLNGTGKGTLSAAIPGAPGIPSAHLAFAFCPPVVSAVQPGFGPREGGTPFTITGMNFQSFGAAPTLLARVGGTAAAALTVVSDTQVRGVTPAGAMGPAAVQVATAYGSDALADGFVYTPAVVTPVSARIGGPLAAANHGPAGGWFLMWLSPATTSVPVPPFGTLLIGPAPLLLVLPATPYPAAGPQVGSLPVPNDPSLVSASLHFQSLAVPAGQPGTPVLTNRSSTLLQ